MNEEQTPQPEREDSITEQFRQKSAELDAQFEERLKRIETRVTEKRADQRKAEAKAQAVRASEGSSARGLALGLQLAYVLVGVPIGMYGLGWMIDRGRGGNVFQTWLTIPGCMAAMFYTIRILNRAQKDN